MHWRSCKWTQCFGDFTYLHPTSRNYLSPEITHLQRLSISRDYSSLVITYFQRLPISGDYLPLEITHLWGLPISSDYLPLEHPILTKYDDFNHYYYISTISSTYYYIFSTNVSEAQCSNDDCLWFSSDLENARFWLSAISQSILLLDTLSDLWADRENARFWLLAIFQSMLPLGAPGGLWADRENARFWLPAIFQSMLQLSALGDLWADSKYAISSTCELTKRILYFGFLYLLRLGIVS